MTPTIVRDIDVEPAVEKIATRRAVSIADELTVVTGVGAVKMPPSPLLERATSNFGPV
jgi:hypothetical protein